MEQDTFRLAVYAIIAAALLYIFFVHFAPAYLWKEKPEQIVGKQLQAAETQLGQYSHQEGKFPKELTMKAEGYESMSRNVTFECNYDIFCCPKGEECSRAIEWDNNQEKRYYSFKQAEPVEVSARCRYENIYICKVFLGKEPAQVKITGFSATDIELDLTKKNTTTIKYAVKNTGQPDLIAAQATARLYKIKKLPYGQEPEKTLVYEAKGEEFGLGTGEETGKELQVEITENGNYEIEFTVQEKTDDTDFETKTFEVKATGIVEIGACELKPPEKEYFSETECRYFLPCEDCKSLIECKRKWREKYGLPKDFEFGLNKYDDVKGSIKLEVPGKLKEECTRNCYPEYEVLDALKESRKPIDLVFVIDASGSMSDDIEETKEMISKIYEQVGEGCTIGEGQKGVEPEPCLQIGLYVFEGGFKDCYSKTEYPFANCVTEQSGNYQLAYPSYYWVLCDVIGQDMKRNYLDSSKDSMNCTNPALRAQNSANNAICTKIEQTLGTALATGPYEQIWPPQCRNDQFFTAPGGASALKGNGSDIGYIPITSDFQKISDALGQVISAQGEEAWSDSLYFVLTADEMHWRPNSEKAIILVTDAFNNWNPTDTGGAEKTIREAVEKANEKNVKVFSFMAKGCDLTDDAILNAWANYFRQFYGKPNLNPEEQEKHCPTDDLAAVSTGTGAALVEYSTAQELPGKILDIVEDEVQRALQEKGIRLCEEGEEPETCKAACILPWENECKACAGKEAAPSGQEIIPGCVNDKENCRVVLSCYSSPEEMTLGECQNWFTEKTAGKEIDILADPEKGQIFVPGIKKKGGVAVPEGEEWDECEFKAIMEGCGGTSAAGGGSQGGSTSPAEPVKPPKAETPSEIECAENLALTDGCYCATSNDALEYADRVKESGKPMDLLIVLDATESNYREATALSAAFKELAEKMPEPCSIGNEACLAVGFVVFGGETSTVGAPEFSKISGSGLSAELEKGAGTARLSSDPAEINRMAEAVKGLGYAYLDEPWRDAIAYSLSDGAKSAIGWREGAQKTILLVTSETDRVSKNSLEEVSEMLGKNQVFTYAAVSKIGETGKTPSDDAGKINAITFTYSIPDAGYSSIRFDYENRPFTDIFKMVLKAAAEKAIYDNAKKEDCGAEKCDACKQAAEPAP
ncbi:MAG: hypothetical protein NT067_06435 [Candidatus Diapherotrites archaeon]|nr:hypothetical protein [Candidatus Diapherotrites archaeon]